MALGLLILGAFLLGSIPTGFLLGLLKGIDLRKHGSGNIGATNATRVLGKKAGLITFIADVLKGAIASALPWVFTEIPWAPAACGTAAVFGHCFSPFLNFNGGKGVATTMGAFLVFGTYGMLGTIAVFALTLRVKRIVSLASLAGALSLPLFLFIFGYDPVTLALGVTLSALVVLRHHENIRRLIKGEEA